MQHTKKTIYPIIIMVALFLLFYLIGTRIPEAVIRDVIKNAGPFGPVIFILFTWTTYIIAPLSGSPFLYAGFYLFGQTTVIYHFIASFIASITNFLIAKKFGRSIVVKLAGEENLVKIDKIADDHGLKSLFFFRVFLSPFHDVLSYVFGLTKLNFGSYLLVSTLGMIPGNILMYLVSQKIKSALMFTLINVTLVYISLGLYLLWRKIVKKKQTVTHPTYTPHECVS